MMSHQADSGTSGGSGGGTLEPIWLGMASPRPQPRLLQNSMFGHVADAFDEKSIFKIGQTPPSEKRAQASTTTTANDQTTTTNTTTTTTSTTTTDGTGAVDSSDRAVVERSAINDNNSDAVTTRHCASAVSCFLITDHIYYILCPKKRILDILTVT